MREDSEGRLAEEVQEREKRVHVQPMGILTVDASGCLLYTSDAADE